MVVFFKAGICVDDKNRAHDKINNKKKVVFSCRLPSGPKNTSHDGHLSWEPNPHWWSQSWNISSFLVDSNQNNGSDTKGLRVKTFFTKKKEKKDLNNNFSLQGLKLKLTLEKKKERRKKHDRILLKLTQLLFHLRRKSSICCNWLQQQKGNLVVGGWKCCKRSCDFLSLPSPPSSSSPCPHRITKSFPSMWWTTAVGSFIPSSLRGCSSGTSQE